MKKILFTLSIVFAALIGQAKPISEAHVPVMVKYSFERDYPKAEHVKWHKTGRNDYEASFQLEEDYVHVYYNQEGKFVESDITTEWQELPFTGRMEMYHLKDKGQVTGVLKVVNNEHKVFYVVGVKHFLKVNEILLDEEGNILGEIKS